MKNGRTDKMKVLFGTDITQNKKNDKSDGDEFIVRSVPGEISEKNSEIFDKELEAAEKTAGKRSIYEMIGLVMMASSFLGLSGMFDEDAELTFSLIRETVSQNPMRFAVFALLFVVGFLLLMIRPVTNIKNLKSEVESDENPEDESEKNLQQAYFSLGVPQDAENVDIFCSEYVIRKGEPELKPIKMFGFANADLKVFADRNELFIADTENLYAIALDSIEKISRYNGKLTMMFWNKETAYNKGKYQPYHIRKRGEFKYTVKTYYSLDINRDGETYKMYFPPYELDVIERLTGMKYEE